MIKTKTEKLDWEDQKGKLKEKYSSLTDKDLYFDKGKMEPMIERLQKKLSLTRHQVYDLITKL